MDLIPPSWTSLPLVATSTTNVPRSFAKFSDHLNISYDEASNVLMTTTTTNLYEDEETLFQGYSNELLTFASASCIVFILMGVPGNLITIIALARCKKVRNATAVFIINLSLSDLLFCCFNLPLAASTFWTRSWNHGELLCRLFPLLRYGLLAVSLFTILSITINRYVMIGHPRIYPRIYRHRYLALMVAGTWLCAFSSLIPTWRGVWGTFGLDKSIGSCSILPDKDGTSPKEFLFIMAFIVPCICITVCYARIFYIVRKTAIRPREAALTNSSVRINGKSQNSPMPENYSDRQLLDKTSKASKEDTSENTSSSASNSSAYPSMSSASGQHKESGVVQQSAGATIRPYLSKLREDELKFIDTSVESDLPPSLSSLAFREKATSAFETEVERSKLIQKADNNVNTHTDEFDGVNVTTGPLNDPKSEEMVSDTEDHPRKRSLKKSLKTSITRITKRPFRHPSTFNTSNASILHAGRMTQKDRRLLKMIMVIFISFVICYLPITITKIWKGVTEVHTINIMGYLLIYLTPCINPIIYVVMSSEYRQAYWNLLLCRTVAAASRRCNENQNLPGKAGNRKRSIRREES